jgi:hypothetical protein
MMIVRNEKKIRDYDRNNPNDVFTEKCLRLFDMITTEDRVSHKELFDTLISYKLNLMNECSVIKLGKNNYITFSDVMGFIMFILTIVEERQSETLVTTPNSIKEQQSIKNNTIIANHVVIDMDSHTSHIECEDLLIICNSIKFINSTKLKNCRIYTDKVIVSGAGELMLTDSVIDTDVVDAKKLNQRNSIVRGKINTHITSIFAEK